MGLTQQTPSLYVCLHVPQFPTQAALRLRPEFMGRPVAVLDGDPPWEQVCSVTPKALQLGISPGMTRAELEIFPGATTLRRSAEEERSARAALLEAASLFSPRMEMQPARSSALNLVLDMTGTSRVFGQIGKAVAKMDHTLREVRLKACFAASANLVTAVCLAPMARRGPLLVAPGQERESLRDLPLSTLPLTAEQTSTLELWGLRTLGELALLPETELVTRLGPEGKRLHLLARGEHPHLMVPEETALTLAEYIAFDSAVELLDSLLFVLGPMLDQLLARAQNHALALASVTVSLGLEGGGEHKRTLKPALPVAQREVLLKLLHLDLQTHPPPAGVMTVSLHAEPGDRSKVQLGLFSPQTPEAMRLDVTLARIAALVGEERVGRARLLDTHAPGNFAMERFTVAVERFTVSPHTPAAKDHELKSGLGLRRCRPPVRIGVDLHEARPAAFSLGGRSFAVQEAFGPWRRSGEWWSQAVWSMEEWDVSATADGGDTLLCVLSHDLLHHHWQMDAMYD